MIIIIITISYILVIFYIFMYLFNFRPLVSLLNGIHTGKQRTNCIIRDLFYFFFSTMHMTVNTLYLNVLICPAQQHPKPQGYFSILLHYWKSHWYIFFRPNKSRNPSRATLQVQDFTLWSPQHNILRPGHKIKNEWRYTKSKSTLHQLQVGEEH